MHWYSIPINPDDVPTSRHSLLVANAITDYQLYLKQNNICMYI